MGLFSIEKIFGATIRESANDGSDFTNPDADYRRLFLGEDGLLHLKDSAGAVTDIGASGIPATIFDAAGDLIVASAADTAARLAKGAAGGYLAMGNSAVIWNSGTSFPASKATNDRYHRTDILGGTTFLWDGTRWISEQIRTHVGILQSAPPFSSTVIAIRGRIGISGSFDTWLTTMRVSTFVTTTNDGSKFWTVSATRNPSGTSLGSFSTGTVPDTASTWTHHTITIDALSGTSDAEFEVTVTKTSTPGAVYVTGDIDYRIVTT